VTYRDAHRWATFGVIDGLVAGAVAGEALVLYLTQIDTGAVPLRPGEYATVLLSAAVYGAGIGVATGLLTGLMIDLLRGRGLSDLAAVGVVMIPALSFTVCFLYPTALPIAAIVVVDVIWRFTRLRRRPIA
jgi:hypothetical protein